MWSRASLCQSLSKPGEFPVSPFRPWCGSSQRGSWHSSLSVREICICISWESLWECSAEIHGAGYRFSGSHEKLGVPGSSSDPQPVLGQDLGFIPGSSCLLGETPVVQRPEAPGKSRPSCCVTPASGSFLRLSSGSFPAPRLFLEFFLSWFQVGSGCSGAPQAVNPSLSRPGRFLWHEWLLCVVLHGVPVVLHRDSSQQGQWEVWRGSRKLNGGGEGTTFWWKATLWFHNFRDLFGAGTACVRKGGEGEEPGWETVSGALGRGGGIPQGRMRNNSCNRGVKFSKDRCGEVTALTGAR